MMEYDFIETDTGNMRAFLTALNDAAMDGWVPVWVTWEHDDGFTYNSIIMERNL